MKGEGIDSCIRYASVVQSTGQETYIIGLFVYRCTKQVEILQVFKSVRRRTITSTHATHRTTVQAHDSGSRQSDERNLLSSLLAQTSCNQRFRPSGADANVRSRRLAPTLITVSAGRRRGMIRDSRSRPVAADAV